MRVLTYNLHGLRDSTESLARVLRAARPDVVCVQEAPRGRPSRLVRLARSVNLRISSFQRRTGLAVLTAPSIGVARGWTRLLSSITGLPRRGLCGVQLDTGTLVASVHLDLSAGARFKHAAEIVSLFKRPAVLGGDFNEFPESTVWSYLTTHFRDAGGPPTFTARRPRSRIDAIMTTPAFEHDSCGLPDADPADLVAASDHLPLLAEINAV